MKTNQFTFVRNNPAAFECPAWVPDKRKLYALANDIYRHVRASDIGGPTKAESMIERLFEFVTLVGSSVAVDLVNEAKAAVSDSAPAAAPAQKPATPAVPTKPPFPVQKQGYKFNARDSSGRP